MMFSFDLCNPESYSCHRFPDLWPRSLGFPTSIKMRKTFGEWNGHESIKLDRWKDLSCIFIFSFNWNFYYETKNASSFFLWKSIHDLIRQKVTLRFLLRKIPVYMIIIIIILNESFKILYNDKRKRKTKRWYDKCFLFFSSSSSSFVWCFLLIIIIIIFQS